MTRRLLELLACPSCGRDFTWESFDEPVQRDEVVEGILRCACGRVFPITRGIPRILDDAWTLFLSFVTAHSARMGGVPATESGPRSAAEDSIDRTRDSFGYQWTTFSEMVIDFRENFLVYIAPLRESFFTNKLGLDLGCGFGRHIYNAAMFGAEMVGVDISDAIESTRINAQGLPNVHLVQADIYHLPFKPGVFDFAYSIGVLHHLPDPERGFQCLVPLVKPGGSVFIWVYSNARAFVNAVLEATRAVTTRLPKPAQKALSWGAATIDFTLFVWPYRVGSRVPLLAPILQRLPVPRLRVYAAYPFQVAYADWFDRLAAPIRFYYDDKDLDGWLNRAQLSHTAVSPTGLFGWRAYGERL